MIKAYVLDTNFFINRQRPINLGENKLAVVKNFVKLTLPLIKQEKVQFLTTPDSHKELASFFTNEEASTLIELNQVLTISSYGRSGTQISSILFEELVAEIGKRLYRGLRTNEELLKNLKPADLEPKNLGQKITELRDKYRRATREGFIDSTIDLGLIFLAKEKNAALVSSDNGLLTWARKFGCQELLPEVLVQKINSLVR